MPARAGSSFTGSSADQRTAELEFRISESILLQLHRDLLRYSSKDDCHRGEWKSLDNHVAAFDADGKQIGIVFETASPFETPMQMEKLLGWHAKEEADPILHPLLRIAVFNVIFLAIHPFQDGNGQLSRVLTNLMLLRAGYAYATYTSLESVIEHKQGNLLPWCQPPHPERQICRAGPKGLRRATRQRTRCPLPPGGLSDGMTGEERHQSSLFGPNPFRVRLTAPFSRHPSHGATTRATCGGRSK